MDSFALATKLFVSPNQAHARSRSHRLRPLYSPPLALISSASRLLSGSAAIAITAATEPSSFSASNVFTLRIHRLSDEFRSLPEPIDRVKRLLFYAADLPPFPDADRNPSNRVTGCTAQVWLSAWIDSLGRLRFAADSDSEITRGFCACLLFVVEGARPEEVLSMSADDIADLNVTGVTGRTHSRVNTWHNVLLSMQQRTRALSSEGGGLPKMDSFSSLVTEATLLPRLIKGLAFVLSWAVSCMALLDRAMS